jgi:hypothetical protein
MHGEASPDDGLTRGREADNGRYEIQVDAAYDDDSHRCHHMRPCKGWGPRWFSFALPPERLQDKQIETSQSTGEPWH